MGWYAFNILPLSGVFLQLVEIAVVGSDAG